MSVTLWRLTVYENFSNDIGWTEKEIIVESDSAESARKVLEDRLIQTAYLCPEVQQVDADLVKKERESNEQKSKR